MNTGGIQFFVFFITLFVAYLQIGISRLPGFLTLLLNCYGVKSSLI